MPEFLSDEETRRLVRDFIVEKRIVRQTVENWLLIRNIFDLSDTEEDGVFRLMRTYNHGAGPSSKVTYSGSHPNLTARNVEGPIQAPNVAIDHASCGSRNQTLERNELYDASNRSEAVSVMGNLLTDDDLVRAIRDFILEHQNHSFRQTEENWLLIRNRFELSDTERKKVYGLIRGYNHQSESQSDLHPDMVNLFGADGNPGRAIRHAGLDPNVAVLNVGSENQAPNNE